MIGCVGAKAGQYYFVIANITPAAGPAQVAMPGGIAQRGDNCTTSPNLAVGYPVPGGAVKSTNGQPLGAYNNSATITNQDAVVVNYHGKQTIGFLIGTKADGYFFTPNGVYGGGVGVVSVSFLTGPVIELPSPNFNSPVDLSAILQSEQQVYSNLGASLPSWVSAALAYVPGMVPTLTAQICFSSSLPANS